jgi:hypothetical protein
VTDPKQAKENTEEPAADEQAAEPKPVGIDYVFKIAPADPKNNFDFEDVADK